MGLEISKIVNEQLQKLAYLKDANNNSILEGDEISIFKEEAAKIEDITAEDFNETMGLFKSEEAKAMTAPEEAKVKRTPDEKQDFTRAKNTVFRYIDILTGKNATNVKTVGVTWCNTKYEEFKKLGADYIINHPLELINILEE